MHDKRNGIASELLRNLAQASDEDVSAATKETLTKLHGPAFIKACTGLFPRGVVSLPPRMPEDVAIDVIARLETSDCEVA
jgi:hypothetical protein